MAQVHTLSHLRRTVGMRWPEIWAETREMGLLRSTPRLILLMVVTIVLVILIPVSHVCRLGLRITTNICSQLAFLSLKRNYRLLQERQRRNRGFQRQLMRAPDVMDERIPRTREDGRPLQPSPPPNKHCFFTLPPEIRRMILVFAFGNRTVHLNLEFRPPIQLRHRGGIHSSHADISMWPDDIAPGHVDPRHLRDWLWFSTVCHRAPPPGNSGAEPLSFGRIACGELHTAEPNFDLCLDGCKRRGHCDEWAGEYPAKCMLGATGWLLSCWQAYREGRDVLYSTNTIHIASVTLLQSMQHIISLDMISSLRSLELVWNPDQLPLDLGFTNACKDDAEIMPSPVFPSLVHLRISFLFNMKSSYYDTAKDPERMEKDIFSKIDDLLDRIVPPATEVIVSCPVQEVYDGAYSRLAGTQGNEHPEPREADIGGPVFWRPRGRQELTFEENFQPDLEAGTCSSSRTGFWIHLPVFMVGPHSENMYDCQFPAKIPRYAPLDQRYWRGECKFTRDLLSVSWVW